MRVTCHNLDLYRVRYPENKLEENSHLFDEYDWGDISWYQKLSESFIEKYKDKVFWYHICCDQKLSKEFIQKHFDKLYIDYLLDNNNISDEIKEEIKTLMEII